MSRPERIPDDEFPSSMSWDERAIRQALYMAWLRSANEFRNALLIAADWFADHNHPDEAVCRSEWVVRSYKSWHGPAAAWWNWTVWPAGGSAWWSAKFQRPGFWLCWPSGWVRLYAVSQRRRQSLRCLTISVSPHRSKPGRSSRWGLTPLFHPEGTVLTATGVVAAASLFDFGGGGE